MVGIFQVAQAVHFPANLGHYCNFRAISNLNVIHSNFYWVDCHFGCHIEYKNSPATRTSDKCSGRVEKWPKSSLIDFVQSGQKIVDFIRISGVRFGNIIAYF